MTKPDPCALRRILADVDASGSAFDALCRQHSGNEYRIPPSLTCRRGRELSEQIGTDAAAALIAWGAGSLVYVPLLKTESAATRAAEVRRLYAEGMTIEQIAREFRYTENYSARRVRSIIASARGTPA